MYFCPCFCFNQHIRPSVSRNFGFIGQLQSPLLLPFPTSISIFCCVHVRDSLSVVVVSAFLILTFHFCMRFRLYLIHSIKSYMCYHLLCGRFFLLFLVWINRIFIQCPYLSEVFMASFFLDGGAFLFVVTFAKDNAIKWRRKHLILQYLQR